MLRFLSVPLHILDQAYAESKRLGEDLIGTEHLFLAILNEKGTEYAFRNYLCAPMHLSLIALRINAGQLNVDAGSIYSSDFLSGREILLRILGMDGHDSSFGEVQRYEFPLSF